MTNSEILLDSIINNTRITTFKITLPRIILPEFNTHRVFSRNFMSSRAIPNKTMLEKYCTFIPDIWRKNQKGMQPSGIIDSYYVQKELTDMHKKAFNYMKDLTEKMSDLGVAKEQVNRYLEPFMYVTGIVTSSDYSNFFNLRAHPDAQYEIRILAENMKNKYEKSVPEERIIHIPFTEDNPGINITERLKISTARCARVSYTNNIDGNISSKEQDLELYKKLIEIKPIHASPAEHQIFRNTLFKETENRNDLCGNIKGEGIVQFRKIIENGMFK